MEIVYKTLGELTPYENNPRNNDEAVQYVKNSIEKFGFKVPIVIDKDGVIVAGHTRYKASMELDLAQVPCIVADDLTDEEIRAFRLADNKTAEAATWNMGMLDEELATIGFDMSQFGFDDNLHIKDLANGEYDFLFTCPPYGNLEVYSDDPSDISNMSDDDFDDTYKKIIANAVSMLKDDRFASIVVGNYRDKNGFMRDLVGLTVSAMESAGAKYYNDFIFITPVGSLPIRAGKQFKASRKMGRTHQYCLNFVKGNPKKATERLGDVEIPDMEQFVEEDDVDG